MLDDKGGALILQLSIVDTSVTGRVADSVRKNPLEFPDSRYIDAAGIA
jgi:hypothetical protein